MISIAKALAAIFSFLRGVIGWVEREENRQAGRDEVAAKTNAETVEMQDAVESVPRPSDDAVADSLRNGRF